MRIIIKNFFICFLPSRCPMKHLCPVAFPISEPSAQDPTQRHLSPCPCGIIQIGTSPPSTSAQHRDLLRQQRVLSCLNDFVTITLTLPWRSRMVHNNSPETGFPRRLNKSRGCATDALGAPFACITVQVKESIHKQKGLSRVVRRMGRRGRRDLRVVVGKDGEIGPQVRNGRDEDHAYVPGYGDLVEGR